MFSGNLGDLGVDLGLVASDSSRARAAYVRKVQRDKQLAEARDRRAAAAALDAGFMGDDFSSDQLADECVTRPLPEVAQTLPQVPAGKLGKLRLRRSGRVELVIGGVPFLLQAAEQVRHYEEAVQMEAPGIGDDEGKGRNASSSSSSSSSSTGSCCLLGRVTHHVTVVPDVVSIMCGGENDESDEDDDEGLGVLPEQESAYV